MELEQGSLIHGRYRIQETLGKGGMGSVYTALDESLGVYVAVKENLLEDENAIEQFRREATILAGLRHPNLPRVTDHFVIEGQGQYLVMDFIEGEDLKMRLQRMETLPEKEVLLIGIAIADAINYLHGLNPPVLHRDIKPGNIRITPDGHVYLVDFGLAKRVESGQMTATGARGLTPGYSPPEQYGTARTDARSDIYALGATLYTALTGSPPEDGLAVAINQTELTPVRTRNPKVSYSVAAVIEKALNVERENRYQTGAEFKRKLLEASDTVNRQVATGELTVSPPPIGTTQVAGEPTLPVSQETVISAGDAPVQPPPPVQTLPSADSVQPLSVAAPKKKSFPLGLVAVIGVVVVGIVAGFVFFSGLLNSGTEDSSVASLPTATEGQTAAQNDEESPVEDQEEVLPAITFTPMDVSASMPTTTPEPEATATPAATPTGGGGMIAFASTRSGEPQIFLLDLLTDELTQLTEISGGACQPEWSNDGQRLVFIAPCQKNQQTYPGSSLFIVNADGSSMNPLPSSPIGDYDPVWSPVTNQIAFTTIRDFNRPQIWVLDVDTGESVNVSNNSQSDYQPAWSADGSKIMFSSNRVTGRAKLWVMDADGQNLFEFSHSDTRTNIEAVWGPDGDLVIYTQFDSRGRGIPNLIGNYWREGGAQAGMSEFRVSDDPTGMREADISPDGLWVVFAYNSNPDNLDIYKMRVNGAEITPLFVEESNDFDPTWRPQP